MSSKDPLAAALDSKPTKGRAGNLSAIERYFGDRPEVKESIIRARERRMSFNEISDALNQDPDVYISPDAVRSWLRKQGVS
jgi:transposase